MSKDGIVSTNVLSVAMSRSPYEVMLDIMKTRSKKRGHPEPELTINDLEQMFINQDGKCCFR